MSDSIEADAPLAAYYRWHAGIYDLTRWAFLFGRRDLIRVVSERLPAPRKVLEIGCGTGSNLVSLARAFPRAEIVGIDLSRDMLDRAQVKIAAFGCRISLRHQAYLGPIRGDDPGFDLIVCSYSLSMINPGFETVLAACREDLSRDGSIAVVDFHESRWRWFRRWMGVNHVRMDGQILRELRSHFEPVVCRVHHGYGDLWRYLVFVGR